MPHIATALLILLLSMAPVASQSRTTNDDRLAKLLTEGVVAAREQALAGLFKMAPGGALTQHMAETHDLMAIADYRAHTISRLLRYDLDGDGAVSRTEIARIGRVQQTGTRGHFDQTIEQADSDTDGAISSAEIIAFASKAVEDSRASSGRMILLGSGFMAFDSDDDNVVTVDDVLKTVDRVARSHPSRVGTNRSDGFSACRLPQPSPDAVAVYIGAHHGGAISTVAVAGRDRMTTFATIVIEDGASPVYLVGNFYEPMVLRITGATDRVERFIVKSEHGIGVAGVPDAIVDQSSLKECKLLSAQLAGTSTLIREKALLIARLGRNIRTIEHHQLGRIVLPSGRITKTENGLQDTRGLVIEQDGKRYRATEDGDFQLLDKPKPSDLYRKFLVRHPGGIESVMPEDVVTDGTAEAYDVLPGHAGLIQLIDSGAVQVLDNGRYAIEDPIARIPAGLDGGYSVEYVLRRGLPIPEGDPGHSKLLIEETGECRGARC